MKIDTELLLIAKRWGDRYFDPKEDLIYFLHPPNPHSSGKQAHLIRESIVYAFCLLLTEEKDGLERAEKILAKALQKQNLDRRSPHFGVFTWEWEQDWQTWKLPDANWAQFVGYTLGFILEWDQEHKRLSESIKKSITAAFQNCLVATLTRNVSASYTNIAMLSIGVAAAADFLFKDEKRVRLSNKKLRLS
jgi:hypothetical protein